MQPNIEQVTFCRRGRCCPVVQIRRDANGQLLRFIIGEDVTGYTDLKPGQFADLCASVKAGKYDRYLEEIHARTPDSE